MYKSHTVYPNATTTAERHSNSLRVGIADNIINFFFSSFWRKGHLFNIYYWQVLESFYNNDVRLKQYNAVHTITGFHFPKYIFNNKRDTEFWPGDFSWYSEDRNCNAFNRRWLWTCICVVNLNRTHRDTLHNVNSNPSVVESFVSRNRHKSGIDKLRIKFAWKQYVWNTFFSSFLSPGLPITWSRPPH